MAAIRRVPVLLLLLSCALSCRGSPLQDLGDVTVPTAPAPTDPANIIDVQEQIYIITGVFIAFIVFLLIVSIATAYVVIGMRQTIKTLQAAGAGLASSTRAGQPPQRKPTRRSSPAPAQQQRNRAFAPDDDDDDDHWGGDEVQNRFDQYPDQPRSEQPRAGRQYSSPSHVSEPQGYDRFHQPLPDAHMPSDRARRDSNSRYGAGNLARLPKGPAPQPGGYDSRYPESRDRRSRSPGRSQW